MCRDDARANDRDIRDEGRLFSVYLLRLREAGDAGHRVYVITEADRSVTTIMLAEEY